MMPSDAQSFCYLATARREEEQKIRKAISKYWQPWQPTFETEDFEMPAENFDCVAIRSQIYISRLASPEPQSLLSPRGIGEASPPPSPLPPSKVCAASTRPHYSSNLSSNRRAISNRKFSRTIMTCCPFIFRKRRFAEQHNQQCDDILGIGNIKVYTYKELRNATGDFSFANKVGEGGFGSVYKGKLKDGKLVALKVLSSESRQGVREFLTELTTISGVVHENLVSLYGCCVEGTHRILVYNYLENNSLAQTLLGSGHSNVQFNWRTRVKICIGVARGLAFLHEEVRPHIVHRDIKASNILLDKDLTPKISDFGLAKLLPANVTHVSTRVAGTIGYLAPEYAVRGQVTRKSDVYSFGVLLLEIVSGRCNTNSRLPYEEQFLLERTWTLYESNELEKIIDTYLADDLDIEEACKFLKVGLLCTQDALKLRPSMSTVVRMLTGERDVHLEKITMPGLIGDFMNLKVRSQKSTSGAQIPSITSSGQDSLPSPLSSGTTTHASVTFTSILDDD
ncbi:hypothetical protein Cni_G27627 [Canna indica]|uniref:Protein kinase domain-containing protein n=1 Tax=Canna indica TaxID=4628 RepID=A0AAQ3L224_9LILI|nr:hypothetical protein Cni_G27627 [Canna indica]